MSYETIGAAQKSPDDTFNQEDAVAFKVPYGDDEYGILLSDEEMDLLLVQGFEQALGRQALIVSGYVIKLESPDLPLFTNVRSLDIDSQWWPTINMSVNIMTQSKVYEHRGILLAHRSGGEERAWQLDDYDVQPPLKSSRELAA